MNARARAGAHFAPAGASGHRVNCNVQPALRARCFCISAGDKDEALSELAGEIFIWPCVHGILIPSAPGLLVFGELR